MCFVTDCVQMKWMYLFVFAAVASLHRQSAVQGQEPDADPCDLGQHTVSDEHQRDVSYVTPPGEGHLCDAYLAEGWYRFLINGSDAVLPTACVEPNTCGTQAPVWLDLQDGLPEMGEEKDSRACSSWAVQDQEAHCCFFTYRVTVRNCGEYFVYRLGSTQACNIAYCVERRKIDCPEGQLFDTILQQCVEVTKPESRTTPACRLGEYYDEVSGICVSTLVEIDRPIITTFVDDERAFINCSWRSLSPASYVEFVVTWYEADVFGTLTQFIQGPEFLELGVDAFAGSTVVCGVKTGTGAQEPNVDTEVVSEPLFMGIKVRESEVKVREDGQPVNLTFYTTVPIYCGQGVAREECVKGVSFIVFGADGEMNERLRFSECYIEFSAADCNGAMCMERLVQVTLYPNLEYSPDTPEKEVTLIGAIDSFGQNTWRQEIVDIRLQLEELPLAQCHMFTDPHVITFDGKIYDLYSRGTFVMHKSLARDFTMHLRVSDCGNDEGYCACGFVARDAGDIVSIDTCSRQQLPGTAEVSFPGNFISDDVKVYESKGGKLLTVVFASGTVIKTYLADWGMSITLLTPATDMGFSRGLCGFYDADGDNDFHDARGKSVKAATESMTALEFVQTWRLPPLSSFFDQAPINDPEPLVQSSRCDCAATNSGGVCPRTSLVSDITPSVQTHVDRTNFYFSQGNAWGSGDLPFTFPSGDEYAPPYVPDYEEIKLPEIAPSLRRRRQVGGADAERIGFADPTVDFVRPRNGSASYFFQPDYLLASTAFIPRWPAASGLDESEATDVCAETLFGSDVALNCAEFLGSSLATAFEFCKSDLKVKGNSSWAEYTVSLLESLCDLGLLQSAHHFREPGARKATWPKILEDAITCPKGCKNDGYCGPTGCLCKPGFRGPECEKPADPDFGTTPDSDLDDLSTYVFINDSTTEDSLTSSTTASTTTVTSTTTSTTTTTPTTTTTTPTTTTTTPTTTTTTPTTTTTTTPTTTTTTPTTTTTTPTTTTTTPTTTTMPTTTTTTPTTTTTTPTTTTTTPTTTTTTPTTTTTTPTTTTTTPTTTTTTPSTTTTSTTTTTTTTPTTTTTTTATTTPLPPPLPTTPTLTTTKSPGRRTTPSRTSGNIEIIDGSHSASFRFLLCDITEERCTAVIFDDVRSQAGDLRCRLTAVEVGDGEVAPLSTNKPVATGSTFTPSGQFVCIIPYLDHLRHIFNTRRPFDSIRVEAILGDRDVKDNSTGTVVSTIIFTVYDSQCRSCGLDGRFGCVTKPNSCFIDSKCYTQFQPQPSDSCLQCRPEVDDEHWSPKANNIAPVINFNERPVVFVGQDVRLRIRAQDPDGSRLILSLNRKDAFISQTGLFQWRALANGDRDSEVRTEVFLLTARDECNETATIRIEIQTVQCGCQNGGTCVDPKVAGRVYEYTCVCLTGYMGSRCEQEVDECADTPCVNGVCVDLIDSFQCVCDPGFEGKLCDIPSDQCQGEPCFPGVLCQPTTAGSFVCGACPPGYTGDGATCHDIDACQSNPCFAGVACLDMAPPSDGFDCGRCPRFFKGNGQQCIRSAESACEAGMCSRHVRCEELTEYPGFRCGQCPEGYSGSGSTCTPICENGCLRGQECLKPGQCGCPPGYVGNHCNIPVCLPACRNGGVCVAPNKCRCFLGYTGSQCQSTSCSPVCANQGRCIGRNSCLCRIGFAGARCQLQACQTPCQNGGQCMGANRCRCKGGYRGQFCEQATCYPPCQNGGTCIHPGRCACVSGYEGARCERALCYPPCQHGGQCKRFNTCKCPHGYVGHRCQTAVCRPACMNRARCVAPNTCSCPSGWSGHRCDRPQCSLPCRNGGMCFRPDICACRSGYSGSDCSRPLCWPLCANGGWCLAPNVCHCRHGFYGPRCRKRKPRGWRRARY